MKEDEGVSENAPGASQTSADRLLGFIETIQNTGAQTNAGKRVDNRSLAEATSLIAKMLDFRDSIAFLQAFLSLTAKVRQDLETLQIRRDIVRANYARKIEQIESTFESRKYVKNCLEVFQFGFQENHLEALHSISDRLQDQGIVEAKEDTLAAAVEDAKSLASLLEESSHVSEKAKRIIKLHLDHLQHFVRSHQTLGERDFWQNYRVLFSSFMEVHAAIADDAVDRGEYKSRLQKMFGWLRTTTSFTADTAAVGRAGVDVISELPWG